ncbi:hypothetical protein BC830DRAFT_1114479 [Chytriomyces sp. MP71]|nr:hypothetical protein BC830DRAFT_1114479 [Chytriomyces sp. MP71]
MRSDSLFPDLLPCDGIPFQPSTVSIVSSETGGSDDGKGPKRRRPASVKRAEQNREAQKIYRERIRDKTLAMEKRLRELEEENAQLRMASFAAPSSTLTRIPFSSFLDSEGKTRMLELEQENSTLKDTVDQLELRLSLAANTNAYITQKAPPIVHCFSCAQSRVLTQYYAQQTKALELKVVALHQECESYKYLMNLNLSLQPVGGQLSPDLAFFRSQSAGSMFTNQSNTTTQSTSTLLESLFSREDDQWMDVLYYRNGELQSAEELYGPVDIEPVRTALKKMPSLQSAEKTIDIMVNAILDFTRAKDMLTAQKNIVACVKASHKLSDLCSREEWLNFMEISDAHIIARNQMHIAHASHLATYGMDASLSTDKDTGPPHPAIARFRAACAQIPSLRDASGIVNQIAVIYRSDPAAMRKFFRMGAVVPVLVTTCTTTEEKRRLRSALLEMKEEVKTHMTDLVDLVAQRLDRISITSQ